MTSVEKLFFALLQNEICGKPLSLPPPSDAELSALCQLAKRQDMAHLIYDALMKNHLMEENNPVYPEFSKQQLLAVLRTDGLLREESAIAEILKKEKIPHLPLKGAVLRGLYPEGWMRTGCDYDLLVRKEDAGRAEKALTARGYRVFFRSLHDVSLVSETGVHIELHDSLEKKDEEIGMESPFLRTVWDRLETDDGILYRMSDADFYFYHIFHMAGHFKDGGCGIRPLIDLWLLNHKTVPNLQKRKEVLGKEGLLPFAENMERLAGICFSGEGSEPFFDALLTFLLSGGIYGTDGNFDYLEEGRAGGKSQYLVQKLFPSPKKLSEHYPILKKSVLLYPFVLCFRAGKACLPGKKATAHKQLSGKSRKETIGMDPAAFWKRVGL